MDTVTQMLFGAVVAQAGFRRRLGRKAMVAGAAVALVPDLDVVAGWVGGTFATWEHHRGLTHSLLFGPIVGPLIGYGLWRLHRRYARKRLGETPDATLRPWIWLSILALMTHPIIDMFTSYGTQLLWPFSTMRFAINSMPIIDPVYSLILIAALIFGSFKRTSGVRAQDVAAAALIMISVYSLGGWAINHHVERVAAQGFDRSVAVRAYPMLFQPYYRRVVATTKDGAQVGYYSVLNPKPINWTAYQSAAPDVVAKVLEKPEARLFEWFAMDQVLWRQMSEPGGAQVLVGHDLRYGMPGTTDASFWGVRADIGADGAIGMVQPSSTAREVSGDAFARFWREMTGIGDECRIEQADKMAPPATGAC